MYVLYEKSTGKIVRASISSVREPQWTDVVAGLGNSDNYSGFTTTDEFDVVANKERYEVKHDTTGTPYLFKHKSIKIEVFGQWCLRDGWQRLLCEGEKTKLIVRFLDETGLPISVSGEMYIESAAIKVSDVHQTIEEREQIEAYVTGRYPCNASLDVHFRSSSHCFIQSDDSGEGDRPLIVTKCPVSIVSRETYLKYTDRCRYDLNILASDSDADGVKDIEANSKSRATCIITKRDCNGNTIPDDDIIRISTTHGRLSDEKMRLKDGVASFWIQSSTETVEAEIRVDSVEELNVIYGAGKLHFRI